MLLLEAIDEVHIGKIHWRDADPFNSKVGLTPQEQKITLGIAGVIVGGGVLIEAGASVTGIVSLVNSADGIFTNKKGEQLKASFYNNV